MLAKVELNSCQGNFVLRLQWFQEIFCIISCFSGVFCHFFARLGCFFCQVCCFFWKSSVLGLSPFKTYWFFWGFFAFFCALPFWRSCKKGALSRTLFEGGVSAFLLSKCFSRAHCVYWGFRLSHFFWGGGCPNCRQLVLTGRISRKLRRRQWRRWRKMGKKDKTKNQTSTLKQGENKRVVEDWVEKGENWTDKKKK